MTILWEFDENNILNKLAQPTTAFPYPSGKNKATCAAFGGAVSALTTTRHP